MNNTVQLNALEELIALVFDIASGNRKSVETLLEMTIPGRTHERISQLAEAIGSIVVQNEAKEFQLELMIKDLLQTHLALENARHDSLTGLPNRSMFHEMLHDQCMNARQCGCLLALLFIDLDKFKGVNDTLGHQAGDELLVHVAERLRSVAGSHGIVARQGGDEFTMLLPGLESEQLAGDVAARIVSTMNEPFSLGAGQVRISCSVGLSFFPKEADSPLTLLKNADVAMYRAKHSGRSTFSLYGESAGEQTVRSGCA